MSYNKFGSRRLQEFRNYRVAPELTAQAIESYLSSLDCPRSLAVWILFKNQEHQQLVDLECNPLHYNCFRSFRDAYGATEFLSKYRGLILENDPKTVALAKFRKFELGCAHTNTRFRNLATDPLFHGPVVWLHNAVIRKIASILGEFKSDEFFSRPNWGPGASSLVKRRNASSQEKFQIESGITRDLHALVPIDLLWEIYPHWAVQLLESNYPTLVAGAKVITVAKNAKTDRVIAVEPGMNVWFQKSIGEMIGSRLRRVGIDITNQGTNQQFALRGSLTGDVATVDLSSASDSISTAVVEALLPSRWFAIMDLCRTHCGLLDGEVIPWSKFSTMGNGFTFPLQTLLFYATAVCCTEYLGEDVSQVSAYGDDIILPVSCFQLFAELLRFYGFTVNVDKSHFCSPFRESCGSHYFSGFDVKPIYLKDKLSSVLSIFRLANAVRRQARVRNANFGCDAQLRGTFEFLIQTVPEGFSFRIPEGFGDGGFVANFDEAIPRRARFGIEGYYFVHAVDVGRSHVDTRPGYLLAELWRLDKRRSKNLDTSFPIAVSLDAGDRVTLRPSRLKAIGDLTDTDSGLVGRNTVPDHDRLIRVVNSLARQWPDLGAWY